MTLKSTIHPRIPTMIVVAAALAGAVLGLFEIANTSIGWHLATGDWILVNRAFVHSDPFSFTSGGAAWIDHEWLFQVGVSIAHSLGGPTALVVLRALTIAGLAVFLLVVGVRSGLSPAAALVLSVVCIAGARGRFFVRPELVTLLIVPTAVWLFLRRAQRSSVTWLVALAAMMIVGANAHGGALIVPPLLVGILTAEIVQMALANRWHRGRIISGFAGVATAVGALLMNPYGWHLLTVPVHLSHLVNLDHIPNPEWISPSPAQAPFLFTALAAAVLVLALRERRLAYWALLLMASVLALRHIRNVGLFFVLLPLIVAPALASWRVLTRKSHQLPAADADTPHPAVFSRLGVLDVLQVRAPRPSGRKLHWARRLAALATKPGEICGLTASSEKGRHDQRRANLLAVVAVSVLALSLGIAPTPRFGIGFAEDYYPESACSFLDAEDLPTAQLYNDVRFGGYLIQRYGPERQVFQDDRNEIHEPLLRRIWKIFRSSDVSAWFELLAGYGADTALVRYHPPIRVTDPAGNDLGLRGFSTLWFPARDWALVYWDDVAMVFVRRYDAPTGLLERHEYQVLRPDDLPHLEDRLAGDPALLPLIAQELAHAARANPMSWRAHEIADLIQR